MKPKAGKVFLIILDGFGLREETDANAVKLSNTPFLQGLASHYSTTAISASGLDVGLPAGLMGNSEVGHLNIGAGRIVYQYITRIDRAIRTEEIFNNETLLQSVRHANKKSNAWHLIGLVSDGGVHSSIKHLFVLLEAARREGVERVYLHAFMDGRDTPPHSGLEYLRQVEAKMHELGVGKIATVCGRYWGMDRDRNWERIEKAYRMLTEGKGRHFHSAVEAVQWAYDHKETDEFIEPSVIVDKNVQLEPDHPVEPGHLAIGTITDGDSVFLFNFRADRAREITRALTKTTFRFFPRERLNLYFATMTQYHKDMTFLAGFPPVNHYNVLGEVISNAGLKQFRIAETEKYAHVTYFFNGGWEKPFPLEDRLLLPSPKVSTYDLQPQMSAPEVTAGALDALDKDYSFILLNFANPDMVGHTGNLEAVILALQALDPLVEQLVKKASDRGYATLIMADHGNCEKMLDDAPPDNPTKREPHTAHTTNPVPLTVIMPDGSHPKLREGGILADIAPTVLQLMRISQPPEMTGKRLIAD